MTVRLRRFGVCMLAALLYVARPNSVNSQDPGGLLRAREKQRTGTVGPASPSDPVDRYDVLRYSLDLTFPFLSSHFDGRVDVLLKSKSDGLDTVALHQAGLHVDSAFAGGIRVPAPTSGGILTVPLPGPLAAGDSIRISVHYHGEPLEFGFYFYERSAYTMSEPSDARAWFPCKDVPRDKAAADVSVTVPSGVEVGSIGRLRERVKSPDGAWETFRWGTDLPVATYLIAVTMSRYFSVWSDWYMTGAGDSIECRYYVLEEDSAKAREDFIHMVDAMDFFSRRFGPYPFEKYGIAEVKPFHYGGMEHQTLTTVNSNWITGDRSVENGFVHELAHSWWGNSVTLNDWPAIWLNEGFATYCEALFREYAYGLESMRARMRKAREAYFNQARQFDFPIYDPPEGELFNWGIEYSKAACVLHMLRKTVGDSVFWAALRSYYSAHRYGNASVGDFQTACESAAQMDLDWFFGQWIFSTGFPVLEFAWTSRPAQGGRFEVLLNVRQQNSDAFHLPLDVRFGTAGTVFRDTTVWILNRNNRFQFIASVSPDTLVLDPDAWNLMTSRRVAWIPEKETDTETENFRCVLQPNYPNPFNRVTAIRIDCTLDSSVADASGLRLSVFNLLGKKVRSLRLPIQINQHTMEIPWDGLDDENRLLPSGIYIFKLEGPGFSSQVKAVLRR